MLSFVVSLDEHAFYNQNLFKNEPLLCSKFLTLQESDSQDPSPVKVAWNTVRPKAVQQL